MGKTIRCMPSGYCYGYYEFSSPSNLDPCNMVGSGVTAVWVPLYRSMDKPRVQCIAKLLKAEPL